MLLLPVPKATAPRRQGQSPRKGRSMERADLNPLSASARGPWVSYRLPLHFCSSLSGGGLG